MNVRPATEADIDFLSTLSREVQRLHAEALPHLFKPPSADAYAAPFFRQLLADPDSCILVAERAGKPVGFVRGLIMREPDTPVRYAWQRLHFKYIAVSPGEESMGCGHALIQASVRFAKERGLATITGDVWSFNTRMKAFLRKEQHVPYCEAHWLDVSRYE